MSLAKSEMTSKSVENSNTEEQLKEQSALPDSGLFKTGGTKPKPLPTHNSSAELPNIMYNRPYPHRFHADSAYFVPQWDHSFNRNRHVNDSPTGPLSRDHNPSLTKFQTKICDHWRRSGSCSYGDACWYAHGEDDLRKLNASKTGRTEDKTNKENEKPVTRRPPLPATEEITEAAKIVKIVEEPKEPKEAVIAPTKRASTNVKGLTVTIPANIAFKSEQVSTNSLPLSPAQERWISMSCGGLTLTGEKMSEPVYAMNELENEFEKKQTLENVFDKRATGQFMRNEDFEKMTTKQDEFGILSPNTFSWSRLSNPTSHMHSQHHRSFSRGPHQRVTHGAPSFPGMPNPAQLPPAGQHQPRISRSVSSVFNCGFEENRPSVCPTHPNAFSRTARDHPQMSLNVPAPQPQIQQACWNLAGDLFQRQKDIETSGVRSIYDPMTRKFEEFELSRLIAQQQKQQQKKQEMLLEYETKKLKDLAMLRYQIERGAISKHQVPSDLMNELIRNLPLLDQHFPPGGENQARHDCSCAHSRQKHPSEHVSLHSQYAQNRQSNLTIQQLIQQQQNLRRYGMSAPVLTDLPAPPKMFESLLPHDDSFSIWLDPKPKKEPTRAYVRAPIRQAEHGTSLLAKMEMLRAEHFPISEEEIALSTGPRSNRRHDSSGGSSPISLPLMELFGNDKLVPKQESKPKTTMFDFDSLKIAETLTMTPQSSRHTSTSGKSDSPKFFVNDEKTPNFDDISPIQTGLFTPLTSSNPTFSERCDFFAASGSCPFGDGCHLSHAIPNQQKPELNAL